MLVLTCSTEIDFTIMFLIFTVNKMKDSENQTIYNGLIMLNTQTLRENNTCESSSISDAVLENRESYFSIGICLNDTILC